MLAAGECGRGEAMHGAILQCPATSVLVVDHGMHMWMKQVGLALVAAGGTLVAVYATTAPQSAVATPPVSRLVDLGGVATAD